jgi:hypothetical protein
VTGLPWLADVLAVGMLLVGGYCASRVVLCRLWHRRTDRRIDLLHAAMGAAMVGMLAPRFAVLAPRAWEAIFIAAAVGLFTTAALGGPVAEARTRVGNNVPHVVMSGAMVYMLAATTSRGDASESLVHGMGSASKGSTPTLALLLLVFMVGYGVLLADRLSAPRTAPGPGTRTFGEPEAILAPRSSISCVIAMALTMAYMLVLMV